MFEDVSGNTGSQQTQGKEGGGLEAVAGVGLWGPPPRPAVGNGGQSQQVPPPRPPCTRVGCKQWLKDAPSLHHCPCNGVGGCSYESRGAFFFRRVYAFVESSSKGHSVP